VGKTLTAQTYHKLHDYNDECSLCNVRLTAEEVKHWRLLAAVAPRVTLEPADWRRIELLCDAWLDTQKRQSSEHK
jgi:hypothetical protein